VSLISGDGDSHGQPKRLSKPANTFCGATAKRRRTSTVSFAIIAYDSGEQPIELIERPFQNAWCREIQPPASSAAAGAAKSVYAPFNRALNESGPFQHFEVIRIVGCAE